MGIVQTDEEQSWIQDGTGKADTYKADTYKADAEEDGTGRGSEGRGQSNFELSISSDYVHEGQRTLAKVCVNAGSLSLL